MTYRAPKGTSDILPPESDVWRRVLRTWEDLCVVYGYGLVITPLFESTDVFARGVGEATEVVEKQMYTFADKKGRSLTLRPEATASLVRAYLQAGRRGILKAWYAGPMFRYEQPQAGRRRQFTQVGVEYVGEDAPAADVEVIELGHRFYSEIGLPVTVHINSIGDAAGRPAYREALLDYLRPRRDSLDADCRHRMEANPLRVLDCKVDGPQLTDAPVPVDYLTPEAADHYKAVKEGLTGAGVAFVEAPQLVRGLDYYTRTVFEYVADDYEASQDSVGGGGRYDGLAEALGGGPVPAIGLSLGVDRIVAALGRTAEAVELDYFVVVADESQWSEALGLVQQLRRAGLRTDFRAAAGSLKAQLKAADRRRAAAALIVGSEWAEGKVARKDMTSGDQDLVAVADLVGK